MFVGKPQKSLPVILKGILLSKASISKALQSRKVGKRISWDFFILYAVKTALPPSQKEEGEEGREGMKEGKKEEGERKGRKDNLNQKTHL